MDISFAFTLHHRIDKFDRSIDRICCFISLTQGIKTGTINQKIKQDVKLYITKNNISRYGPSSLLNSLSSKLTFPVDAPPQGPRRGVNSHLLVSVTQLSV